MRPSLYVSLLCGVAAFAAAARADDVAGKDGGEIIVTGRLLRESAAIGKSDIPVLETPQAISVVPQELIEARGVTRLADALRTVAGISSASTYGFYDGYTIRGYDASYSSVYLDGLISETGVGTNQELFGLERVEVLKGPASMLFGQAPLGGLINLVSKRPHDDAFLNVSASAGSWNAWEGTLDANAPLTSDGRVLARLSVLYRDTDSFVRNAGQNRIFVAPAVTWKIGPQTELTVLGRWQRDHDNPYSPLPAYGTVLPGVVSLPVDFSLNGRGDQRVVNNQERRQIGYVFEHHFSNALRFTQSLRYTYRTTDWDRWMFAAGFIDANGHRTATPTETLGRFLYGPYHTRAKDLALDSRMAADFSTGSIRHAIVGGVDYRQNRENFSNGGDYNPLDNPLSLTNPDYDRPLVNLGGAPYADKTRSHQTGLYAQDHMKFGDRFTLTLGGRYDWVDGNGDTSHAFSPRVGATFAILPEAVAYASWSKSFTPQSPGDKQVTGVTGDGTLILASLPPERGENYEIGLKFAPAESAVSGTIALFQLTRQNVETSDPDYPNFFKVSGEQRSRGIELEGQWRPLAGLSLNVAYAYIRGKITRDNDYPVGAELLNFPHHNLTLFGQYAVQDGALKGLYGSLGMTYNSQRSGSYQRDASDRTVLPLPGYAIVDAGLGYRRSGWGIQGNIGNLFDKRYWPSANALTRVTPGMPRNFRITVSREF